MMQKTTLTEKGKYALAKIKEYFPKGQFSAKDLTDACGERIAAATLNSVAAKGYITRLGGSPVQFQTANEFDVMFDNMLNEDNSKCDNQNLRKAAKVKNDEFYTLYSDIEDEVMNYRSQFYNKVVYLPCDDPADDNNPEFKKSEFWSFFVRNFTAFGLKRLIATHYNPNGCGYKIYIDAADHYITDDDARQEDLEGNGDFQSEECVKILDESDIIVTNPPFSLFSELVTLIIKHNKEFLLIGSDNKITDKTIFPLFKEEKIRCGYNSVKEFKQPDGTIKKFGNIHWYTTLKTNKIQNRIYLNKEYSPSLYPKYDEVDAIEVGRVINIPKDYSGWMGVPISILYNQNFSTEQFEIIGILHTPVVNLEEYNYGMPNINGQAKYARIIVRNKEI